MKKIIVSLPEESVSAAANPYLDVDGHFNLDKVQALNAKVTAAVAKFTKANSDAAAPKPEIIYVIPRKAKPVKYSKSLEAKKDVKYMAARAIAVKSVKRMTEQGKIRNLPILAVYGKDVIGALAADCRTAVSALTRHYNKALKTKDAVAKIKTVVRDAANAEYDESVSLLKDILAKAGIKNTDMVESKGMMGKTVLLKVGKENVVSIGKSDLTKFRAAVKAAKETV